MAELVHADVFFFITTIAVIVVSLEFALVLLYVLIILNDVRVVSKKVRMASDELERDFEILRASVTSQSVRVKTIIRVLMDFIGRHLAKARSKKDKGRTSE